MSATGWFADVDNDGGVDQYRWCPVLQADGVCLPLPVWFDSKKACEEFIERSVVGRTLLP